MPIGVPDCPVDIRCLESRRVTMFGDNRREEDFWVGSRASQKVGQFWTGSTTFFVKKG